MNEYKAMVKMAEDAVSDMNDRSMQWGCMSRILDKLLETGLPKEMKDTTRHKSEGKKKQGKIGFHTR